MNLWGWFFFAVFGLCLAAVLWRIWVRLFRKGPDPLERAKNRDPRGVEHGLHGLDRKD